MLIASLRDVIRRQSTEVESLQNRLKEASTSQEAQVCLMLSLLISIQSNRTLQAGRPSETS